MASMQAKSIGQTHRNSPTIPYSHDDFVWKLARKFTNSNEEAVAAAEEMFADIRRCAEGVDDVPPIETRLTAKIAFRRLLKFLQ